MNDLINALLILQKYLKEETHYPTCCSHDVLYVPCVNYNDVSEADKKELAKLGFIENTDGGEGFMSRRFGSC